MTDVPAQAFQDCLVDLDVHIARRLWVRVCEHLPQPQNDNEMLVMLHHARTQAESIDLRMRAYSHAWLCERSLPSGLPDELKPAAERIYPKIVSAVGVAVKPFTDTPSAIELAKETERVMSEAVAECYADGVTDPEVIRARMREAQDRV
jgi:hypothetical protein